MYFYYQGFGFEYQPTKKDLKEWLKQEGFGLKNIDDYVEPMVRKLYPNNVWDIMEDFDIHSTKGKLNELKAFIILDKDKKERFENFIINRNKIKIERKLLLTLRFGYNLDYTEAIQL